MKLAILGACALSLAACSTTQVRSVVAEGQLVCAAGPTTVAMFVPSGAAILAKGATKQAVDAVCGLVGGIAVSLPGTAVPSITVTLPASVSIPLKS